MLDQMVEEHGIDKRRIFIVGLSAGGAMAAAMLAAYPEVFAGGAVIAGLPYGSAVNVQEALQAMAQPQRRSGKKWGELVRSATSHSGPWPKISLWHGSADAIVNPHNMEETSNSGSMFMALRFFDGRTGAGMASCLAHRRGGR
jgi:feruloyl esterase